MKQNRYFLATLLLFTLPVTALANAGTPLIWVGMIHLSIGNLIIGLFEGLLLAKAFGLSKRRCIGLIILANYFSAWLGGLLIAKAIAHALPMDLKSAWPLLWFMVIITYLLTLVLEFPFVGIAFRGDSAWRRKSIRGSLLVQTVSYVILFGWYWLASGTSLYTQTKVVKISSIDLPETVLVCFISVDDGDAYAGSLRDQHWRKIFDLNSTHRNDRLLVRPSSQGTNEWDLVARLETDVRNNPNLITV